MQTTITRPSTGKTYTITTDHSASSYGIPVVLEDGRLIEFGEPSRYRLHCGEWYDELSPEENLVANAAAEMEALYIGLRVGANCDRDPSAMPFAMEMVEAAYYRRQALTPEQQAAAIAEAAIRRTGNNR
jgi:hypothetical protein